MDNGVDGPIKLLLLECCSETTGAGITVEAEWSRLVDDSIPVGKYEYWWGCEFCE